MTTIDWLNGRILQGESLLLRMRDLDAGTAQGEADLESPSLLDVRACLMEFRDWEAENLSRLCEAFGHDSPWVAQYRGIRQVDPQLALTDFTPQKGRIEASLIGKLDQLRSIREAVVRRIVPGGKRVPRVFLGHARSAAWRELEDFLIDGLGLDCGELEVAPAVDARVAERLDHLQDTCRFAVLLWTAEDERHEGASDARENVLHEIGLFQGRLGRARVVVLVEQGCREFSNVHGVLQVPFPAGGLRSTFAALHAALQREGLLRGRSTAA